MTNEDVIITSPNTIEAVIDAAGVVSVQLDKTGYTENEASVMAGKAAIAAAIKKQGIGANKDDSFSTLADKVQSIPSSPTGYPYTYQLQPYTTIVTVETSTSIVIN